MRKKLYVVRGIGCWASDVWVSKEFDVTILIEMIPRQWQSALPNEGGVSRQVFCEYGFRRATGIKLDPGEYTTIELEEVDDA